MVRLNTFEGTGNIDMPFIATINILRCALVRVLSILQK